MLLHWNSQKCLKISYYCYKLEYIVVSGHVMAIYLKWCVCPCHEPLVAQISICSITFGRVEYNPELSRSDRISVHK